jgi:DivIVA domain-containing protein
MTGMDVSPKTLRDAQFRYKTRGYHTEDVDHFLEEVAAGLELQQERLRQALERAQRAEAAAAEVGGSDETLRKTLVLAQRTADLAVQEAREQAARILAGAEQQAQSIVAEAEEKGRRTLEDTTAQSRAELSKLETSRAQAQQDVDTLNRWLEEHKAHLIEALSDAMAAVERAGVLWPAPSTRPADIPGSTLTARPAPTPAPPPAPDRDQGPDTAVWSPSDEEGSEAAAASPSNSSPAAASGSSPADATPADTGDRAGEQALDDFFDENDEFSDDRRFGSRLRRRR